MRHRHLHILIVEDNEDHAYLLRRFLFKLGQIEVECDHVTNGDACISSLSDRGIDVVFLDYHLGGSESGLDVLNRIRGSGDTRGIIVMTSQTSVSLAVQLTQAGADDYIEKGSMTPEVLRRTINHAMAQRHRRDAVLENQRLVSELRSANDMLERKNTRLAELYSTAHQFVDNVSHEFRTPLAVIKEYASLMRDGVLGDVNSEQTEFLDVIDNRVEDLALMVDDMLEISRFGAGLMRVKRQSCSFGAIIDHIRPNLERRALINDIKLKFDVQRGLPELYCDPEKVGRTIINLAVNGLKFAPRGGSVLVRASVDLVNAEVVISVRDDGPGISEDNRKLIFERFKQVNGETRQSTKGFGLGLNIARELVHVNLGRIEVESELGEGSEFRFTVPISDPQSVLSKYVNWLLAIEDSLEIAVVWCSVDGVGHEDQLRDVGVFLRGTIRPRDLVFSAANGLWLIVAQCGAGEADDMIQRLDEALQETNRNRPGEAIPGLRYDLVGTWELPVQQEILLNRFEILNRAWGQRLCLTRLTF